MLASGQCIVHGWEGGRRGAGDGEQRPWNGGREKGVAMEGRAHAIEREKERERQQRQGWRCNTHWGAMEDSVCGMEGGEVVAMDGRPVEEWSRVRRSVDGMMALISQYLLTLVY